VQTREPRIFKHGYMFQVIRPGSVKYIQYIASSDALFFGSCRRDFLRSKKKTNFFTYLSILSFSKPTPLASIFHHPLEFTTIK